LSFDEWFEIESDYDFGFIKISNDNGITWRIIGQRTGKTEKWVKSQIDISQYCGQEIILSFELVTDNAKTFKGWNIDDFIIEYSGKDMLEVNIQSFSSQNFPIIYSNVNVNYDGAGISTLDQSNFQVFENGNLQTELFQVTPPSQGSGSKIVDIVFCMDISGSMSNEIQQVSDNLTDFVLSLGQQGIEQYGLGLVIMNSTNPYICNNGQLVFNDANYFLQNVWKGIPGIYNYPSGREVGLDAMVAATNSFNFVAPQKIIIMITDEGPSYNGNWGNYNTQQTIDILNSGGFNGYCLIESSDPGVIQEYGQVGIQTNGNWFDILSPFDDILDDIVVQVSNTYEVRYKSSDPNCNGILRNIEMKVNYDGDEASAFGSYMPCEAPIIYRNPATIALHNQAWAENTPFTIEVIVEDNNQPFVNIVKLFYKNTLSHNYQTLNMVNSSGNTWTAIVPGTSVFTPGFDYYVTASDGQTTVSTPSVSPAVNPFQIAILPNVAPLIQHEPVQTSIPNQEIVINASVTDETNELSFVFLYFREYGDLLYTGVFMQQSFGNEFSATIPTGFVTEAGVQYYIYAEDDLGVGSYHGTADEPHFIDVGNNFWESNMNNGIALQIIETKGTHEVKFVGYKYRMNPGSLNIKAFPVSNSGYVFLSAAEKGFWDWYVTFDNQILLFNSNPETNPDAQQIGHINFEYSFKNHLDYTRHAIIIFHNDDEMCLNPESSNKPYFPYGPDSPDYPAGFNNKWNYFSLGEYPVSMLIPPYYSISNNESGYKMPDEFNKKPILFVHGLLGTFSYAKPADDKKDEISYWFNTERIVNNHGDFHAWQIYYPNTLDIFHASLCLKYDVENVLSNNMYNQKINIVSHSMGGLVSMEYLTSNQVNNNQEKIGKVLLSVPPIHGSYGANKQYRTGLGRALDWFSPQDKDAPCYRDMSIGSMFMNNLHCRNWGQILDFNGSGNIWDDVFVIVMNTEENYFLPELLHIESKNNSDAIVAISSASLIDHGIGFATLNGNHDDGRFTIDNLNDENILPQIVINYFNDLDNPSQSYDEFIDYLDNDESPVDVIYSFKNDEGIIRPNNGQTLENLESSFEVVDYQKGLICISGLQNGEPYYYSEASLVNNALLLKPNKYDALGYTNFDKPYVEFKLNPFAQSYHGIYGLYKFINLTIYTDELGNGIKLPNQNITFQFYENSGQPIVGGSTSLNFSNCRSHYETISAPVKEIFLANNETDNKLSIFNPDNKESYTSIIVDDQTSAIEFSFYSEDTWINGENFSSFLEMPDGSILDSTSVLVEFSDNHNISNQRFLINSPMPGEWKAWSETVNKNAKSTSFHVKANLQTELVAFTNMTDTVLAVGDLITSNIIAGLLVNDTSLLSEVSITAVISGPSSDSTIVSLDSKYDSTLNSIEYFKEIIIDATGYHFIKFSFSGIYNGFDFERVVYHHLLFVDQTPLLAIPDFTINPSNMYLEFDPRVYTQNILTDSMEYSFSIISASIDTAKYYANYDDDVFFITTDLTENGLFEIEAIATLLSKESIKDTFNVLVEVTFDHKIDLGSGWSAISSYLEPESPQLENIFFDQITNSSMVIMLGKSGIFWPGQNINTIGNWNPYDGYKVKMNVDDQVIITGEEVVDKTVNLSAGTTFLPVLLPDPVPATTIFDQIEDELLFAFDLGGLIYWPDGGIYDLQLLEPGKAYLLSMLADASVTFPESGGGKQLIGNKIRNIENSPWKVTKTGNVHIISIFEEALTNLKQGDVIAAFNTEGACVGVTQFAGEAGSLPLVVYGNDFTTEQIDGLVEGEAITVKVYDPLTQEASAVYPVWDSKMPNSGQFVENGLSAITSLKAATSLHRNRNL